MNKKVMALAVAGALAAPAALAQVQIGGSIHLQYFNNDTGSDASKKTDILTTSEPEIYFRGEEKLGGGLSTWFQCTSSFDVLGQGLGSWCGRNSAIGFRGDFGNAFAGTWDTPHKLVSNLARGWWGGTNVLQGGTLQLLANGSDSNSGNTGISFFRRQRRSINYHSPDWGGFNLQAAFSAANEATGLPEASEAKPRMYSIAGQFRTGPFFAGLGYEKHNDFMDTTATSILGTDTSFNVAAGFTFAGAIKVSALYLNAEYKPDGGVGKREHDGFAFYLDWTLGGPHKLYAQFATRGDIKLDGTEQTDTGGDVFGIAYGYSFSKRTQGYIAYNELKPDTNGVDANGDGLTNTSISAGATSPGAKQKVIGVGLRHSF